MSSAPACPSRRVCSCRAVELAQRLVARELAVDRIGKVGLDQPHLELGCLRQPIVDLAHAHCAENQGGCENRRCRGKRNACDARLVECIVEGAVDHHQQCRDAPGTGELGDLDDQRMPGLADPLTAGKYLRHEELAYRHDRRREQDHRNFAAPADAAHNGGEQQEDERASGAEQKKHPCRRNPREIRKTLHDIDQPVKPTAGLDHPGPPAEE